MREVFKSQVLYQVLVIRQELFLSGKEVDDGVLFTIIRIEEVCVEADFQRRCTTVIT